MPQLDFFVFFSNYSAFILFFIGFIAFQSWSLPFLSSTIKLGSNRMYLYYFSILHASHKSSSVFFLDLFYGSAHFLFWSNHIILSKSNSFFFTPFRWFSI